MLNAASVFVDASVAEGRGPRPAARCPDRVLTYADVQDLADRTARALGGLGVGREDRVVLLCHDSPEFLGAFWGAIKAGAVAVPVNTFLTADEWLYCLDDSAAPVAVVSAALLEAARPAFERARLLRTVLVAGAGPRPGGGSVAYASYDQALASAGGGIDPAPTQADDPALWLYSSGSTGAPKAAIHRHRDMPACAHTYARHVLGIRP
jgi:acyl-coenzyme A synthetase/AMP-(fatty) acid ligase